jgi:hypothetical protein
MHRVKARASHNPWAASTRAAKATSLLGSTIYASWFFSETIPTDADYYEQHADSVELWSPGNPLFQPTGVEPVNEGLPPNASIRDLIGL